MSDRLASVSALAVVLIASAAPGCGADAEATSRADAQADGAGATGGASGAGGATDAATETEADAPLTPATTCFDDPPPGATLPPAWKQYAGTCPTFVAAPAESTIQTSGADRTLLLAIPSNLQPDEKLPIVFLWHWSGGSPDDFYTRGDVQKAVDTQRFLAVIPAKKGDVPSTWPMPGAATPARIEEEYTLFDDVLACLGEQFPHVVRGCVSSVGVSVGAVFTDHIASDRADYLSSFISLSGGTSTAVGPWGNPAHRLPGLVLWGGPTDKCYGILDFTTMSNELETALTADGNFLIECVHNCGHSVPPFDPPSGLSTFASMWQFVFDHPYWLPAGQSPYLSHGLPAGFPEWCAIGQGNATMRTGACTEPPGC